MGFLSTTRLFTRLNFTKTFFLQNSSCYHSGEHADIKRCLDNIQQPSASVANAFLVEIGETENQELCSVSDFPTSCLMNNLHTGKTN